MYLCFTHVCKMGITVIMFDVTIRIIAKQSQCIGRYVK